MPPRRLCSLVALLLAGCGGDGGGGDTPAPAPESRAQDAPTATATPTEQPARRPRVRRARCGPDAGNCAAVTGRVLYVEDVDPDGDGDAHYVLAGGKVTAPGVSVIDVGPALRPHRLPRRGELVSAAGPVYAGSYGQRQIQAVELHHQPPRG